MTPERWQRIEQVLHAALACQPTEREALLDVECDSDYELRAEVESLLESAQGAQTFLEANALEDAFTLLDVPDVPPRSAALDPIPFKGVSVQVEWARSILPRMSGWGAM